MKFKRIRKIMLIISLLFLAATSHGQLPGFNDSQNDAQPAPISSIVVLGLVAGAFYGIREVK